MTARPLARAVVSAAGNVHVSAVAPSAVGEPGRGGDVRGETAPGTDGDHLDGVGGVVVGPEPVDDPEPVLAFARQVEAQPPATGEVAGDLGRQASCRSFGARPGR